ncbi:MAG: hypothetical protein ACI8PZ_003517 [Myxococcota bacterium]|jgi:hypothetical protein
MKSLVPLMALALLGCGGADPASGTLSQNVGASFAPCNEQEIKFLATKHNFMTAFRPCGNNNFQHYAWSPDGKHLYFQLVMVGHVMDADQAHKPVVAVPTPSPIGGATWLSNSRLAVPVGGAQGLEGGPDRVALFDIETPQVFYVDLPGVSRPDALQRGRSASEVLLLATDASGHRTVHSVDVADGATSIAFPWLTGEVDTFTLQPDLGVMLIGRGNTVHMYDLMGAERGSWSPASRGVVHPGGEWLALEHLGAPVSIFYQRAWDELSERARQRELARTQQFIDTLPENYPTEVQPPTLSFVYLPSGDRWLIDSAQGHAFQWYNAMDYYGSFLLWGFESKEFKRNVLLGNFRDRMIHMVDGREMMGVQAMTEGNSSKVEGLAPLLDVGGLATPPSDDDAGPTATEAAGSAAQGAKQEVR